MNRPTTPFAIPARDLPLPGAASPTDAPPPPDDLPQTAAMIRVTARAARPRSRLSRWFWSALGALISLAVSIAAYDFIDTLMARNPALGTLALALTAIVALVVLVQLLREWIALRRLVRIDRYRLKAAAALASDDRAAALRVSEALETLYAGRPELRWSRERLAESRAGVLDADAMIALTERSLLDPLDAAARAEIEMAARTVAGVTALVPLAFADVLAALSLNIRMIRRLAEIYGGHAGVLGSWRLLKMVAGHLLATGAVAVGDDMIHSVAGGSALARVSRRFGEGVINGALTARIGIAAMEVCRPLPFAALPRPKVTNVLSRSMTGLFDKDDPRPAP